MSTENRSSSNHGIRTFTLDSLTAALEQVQALHEISADLIAESVFGQPAQQGHGEPIMLAAVGELQEDGDGGLEVQWLLEGGTSELLHGMTLLVAENAPELCSEDGSAQVYTHADPAEALNDLEDAKEACAEIERTGTPGDVIRGMNDEMVDTRAQLAEAQALLLELEGDHTLMLQMGASEFGPTECKTLRARLVKLRTYLRVNALPAAEILVALSASAEPSATGDGVRDERDYAIEHAGYLADAADQVLADYQAYSLAQMLENEGGDDGDDEHAEAVDSARDELHEGLANLRSMTYEFRKRRPRGNPAPL